MSPTQRRLYALRQLVSRGASRSEIELEIDRLITLDSPDETLSELAVGLDRATDRGEYPLLLARQIAHALPRLWILTGWIRLDRERRYERHNAATGVPIAWVWCGEEWWEGDRHESGLGTWVYRVVRRAAGDELQRPAVSRAIAWSCADELLLGEDGSLPPWTLMASTCPICRGGGELLKPGTESTTYRCQHCDGTGEIPGGEG